MPKKLRPTECCWHVGGSSVCNNEPSLVKRPCKHQVQGFFIRNLHLSLAHFLSHYFFVLLNVTDNWIIHKVLSPPSCPHQGSMWSYCLNEEVLKLGLARTAPIVGLLPDSRLYWRLHKRLHRAEVRAERKGRGLWKQDSLLEKAWKAVSDSTLVTLMKRIFKRTWCTKLLNPFQSLKKNSECDETQPILLFFFFFKVPCYTCLKVFFPLNLYLTFSRDCNWFLGFNSQILISELRLKPQLSTVFFLRMCVCVCLWDTPLEARRGQGMLIGFKMERRGGPLLP